MNALAPSMQSLSHLCIVLLESERTNIGLQRWKSCTAFD
jgi:hypothetical protein